MFRRIKKKTFFRTLRFICKCMSKNKVTKFLILGLSIKKIFTERKKVTNINQNVPLPSHISLLFKKKNVSLSRILL